MASLLDSSFNSFKSVGDRLSENLPLVSIKKLLHQFIDDPIGDSFIAQFFGGRVDGLHGDFKSLFVFAQQFHFRMGHRDLAIVPIALSEDDVGCVQNEVLPDPLLAPEPHQFHFPGVVNESRHKAFSLLLFYSFDVNHIAE